MCVMARATAHPDRRPISHGRACASVSMVACPHSRADLSAAGPVAAGHERASRGQTAHAWVGLRGQPTHAWASLRRGPPPPGASGGGHGHERERRVVTAETPRSSEVHPWLPVDPCTHKVVTHVSWVHKTQPQVRPWWPVDAPPRYPGHAPTARVTPSQGGHRERGRLTGLQDATASTTLAVSRAVDRATSTR